MFVVLLWWLVVEVMGLIAWPIAFVAFRFLPDRGYFLSKPLGILITSYLVWLAGTFHVLPNSRGAIIIVLLLLATVSFCVFFWRKAEFVEFWRTRRNIAFFVEVMFGFAFVLGAFVRSYNPEISGTEKPMELAFLNSTLRSEYFPPGDPWLSGFSISYYYFGYVMMAILAKLAGVTASIAFNLAISLLFALTITGAFGIVFALVWRSERESTRVKSRIALLTGTFASIFVGIAGNLEGVLEIFRSHGWGTLDFYQWVSIRDLGQPYQSPLWYPTDTWWWWRASRVIGTFGEGKIPDYTITEFPFFSFLLGDMHPHVLALPFVFLALGLALNLLFSDESVSLAWVRRRPLELVLTALVLGSLGFLNSWDFPTYTVVFMGVLAIKWYWEQDAISWQGVKNLAVVVVGIGAAAILLYLPFYVGFRSQASGVLPVRGVSTSPLHFTIFWGLFLFIMVVYLTNKAIELRSEYKDKARFIVYPLLVVMLPFALWMVVEAGIGIVGGAVVISVTSTADKLEASLLYIVLAWLALVILALEVLKGKTINDSRASLFVALVTFIGFLLVLGCELFFIRDVFGNRMNTVFKFYYQVWVLIALASAYGLYYIGLRRRPSTSLGRVGITAYWMAVAILFVAVMVYSVAAIASKTNGFSGNATLDGLDYTRRINPDEYGAIAWLAENGKSSETVLESVGGQYSEYARVSTRTGLPAVLGWAGHELQWRGTDNDFKGREGDIDEAYRSPDSSRVLALLKKYDVRYVYVGLLEKGKYGTSVSEKFNGFLDVVYRNGGVTIYRVPNG